MSDSPGLIGTRRLHLTATPIGVAMMPESPHKGAAVDLPPKTPAELRADLAAMRDASATVTRCAFCDWLFDGTAAEGRQAALEHREAEHPAARNRKGRRRGGWLRDDNLATRDADRAEQNRRRQEREDAARLEKIEAGRAARGEAA